MFRAAACRSLQHKSGEAEVSGQDGHKNADGTQLCGRGGMLQHAGQSIGCWFHQLPNIGTGALNQALD